MSKLSIKAELRELGNKADMKEARRTNKLPAVLYGFEQDTMSIWIEARAMDKVFEEAGTSSLVEVMIDDKDPVKVIVKDIQLDPVSDKLIHIDFYKVDLKKTLDVEVPIIFSGISPAVKALGGVLIHGTNSIHVRCLPEDLIREVKLSLESLVELNDIIHVSSLDLPEGVELLTDPEQVVASVKPPKVEVEKTPEEEAAEADEAKEAEGDDAKDGDVETKDDKDAKVEEKK